MAFCLKKTRYVHFNILEIVQAERATSPTFEMYHETLRNSCISLLHSHLTSLSHISSST